MYLSKMYLLTFLVLVAGHIFVDHRGLSRRGQRHLLRRWVSPIFRSAFVGNQEATSGPATLSKIRTHTPCIRAVARSFVPAKIKKKKRKKQNEKANILLNFRAFAVNLLNHIIIQRFSYLLLTQISWNNAAPRGISRGLVFPSCVTVVSERRTYISNWTPCVAFDTSVPRLISC